MTNNNTAEELLPAITVELVDTLSEVDMSNLCEITESTINAGGGFGWITAPARESLERYWSGVLAVPQRHLIIARMDGMLCGAVQLVEPTLQNEAQSFAASLLANFVAPWARGYNIGRELAQTLENLAIEKGYTVLNVDIRETQRSAITLFESLGYKKWGENPYYAQIDGKTIKGLYYTKVIARPVQQRPSII
ncbi:MAG: N-acetyltransferase family protein [Pseudomonadota bacterium]